MNESKSPSYSLEQTARYNEAQTCRAVILSMLDKYPIDTSSDEGAAGESKGIMDLLTKQIDQVKQMTCDDLRPLVITLLMVTTMVIAHDGHKPASTYLASPNHF